MKGLVHGGDLYGYTSPPIDFSVNTNPLGLPASVRQALFHASECWERYPDPLCRTLCERIAVRDQVHTDWVHCGNGAADLLYRIALSLRPARALIAAPTFSEYESALDAVGCIVKRHLLQESEGFQLTERVLEQIEPALNLVVLCNPNNPTGLPIDHSLLLRILNRCATFGILLLVDECFLPFLPEGQEGLQGRLAEFPNLLLLRAFTKLYAMAGLRLGYLLCSDQTVLERIQICEPPWNVSGPAQIAGLAALECNSAYLEQTRKLVHRERSYLETELHSVGAVCFGSQANYLFFKLEGCCDLREKLVSKGYLIRSCGNYHGLDGQFYRIAVKIHEENAGLIRVIKEVLGTK